MDAGGKDTQGPGLEFLTDEEERQVRRSRKERSSPAGNHLEIGRLGEDIACRYLWRRGFRVIERNFRIDSSGEIDIVAEKRGRIHFVEVKTRTSQRLGAPEERVDRKKQKALRDTASRYLATFREEPQAGAQFDVLAQVLDGRGRPAEQRLLENCF